MSQPLLDTAALVMQLYDQAADVEGKDVNCAGTVPDN